MNRSAEVFEGFGGFSKREMSIRDSNNSIEQVPFIVAFAVVLAVILAAIGAGNGSDENDPKHQCEVHHKC